MDAMGVAYEAGQSGRTKRDTAELRDAQWAVARAKHDYDADPSEVNKSALEIATTKMKAFADVLGEGAYEQALEAAYDAAAQFDTGDLLQIRHRPGIANAVPGLLFPAGITMRRIMRITPGSLRCSKALRCLQRRKGPVQRFSPSICAHCVPRCRFVSKRP